MPHTTFQYPFEAKVGMVVGRLRGENAGPVLFVLEGATFTRVAIDDWQRQRSALVGSGAAYVFQDPFELEYTWLEWAHVPQGAWEDHLGEKFQASDFHSLRTGTSVTYPDSWGVMF